MKPYYDEDGITIYHGDCLDILHDLDGIGAVITDPPYSSGGTFRGDRAREPSTKYVLSGTAAYRPEFAGDNRDQRTFFIWSTLWLNAARNASAPGAVLCSFIDWRQLPTLSDAVQVAGWTWRGVAVWSKKYGRPTPGRFSNACEYVLWGSNGPMEAWDSYPPGIYEASPPSGDAKSHIAQKPLEVMDWLLRVVRPGSVILDPFMGSGTTLEAAKRAGFRAIGIDVDERYCEIAAQRLAQGVLAL